MLVRSIRFSQTARDQLARLKRHTGIEHMNVLARWGLCTSLAETIPPPPAKILADSNLEMSWEVFGGRYADILVALMRERCLQDGLDDDDETVVQQLKLHVHRGLAYLAGDRRLRSVAELIARSDRAG